jgi:hypothetical protein
MSGQLSLFGDLELDPLIRTTPEEKGSSAVLAMEVAAEPVGDQLANESIRFLQGADGLEEAEIAPMPASVAPPAPVMTPEEQFDVVLQNHWINSQDLAYCMVNTALPEDGGSLYDDFTHQSLQACGYRSRNPARSR